MTETVVDVRGLCMRYGSRDVLTGVDFAARRGEVIILLGPNGAGKSTTIEILEGFRISGSWRQLETVAVLGAWAVAGLLLAPAVPRRMARRESGSAMEARRQQHLQRTP